MDNQESLSNHQTSKPDNDIPQRELFLATMSIINLVFRHLGKNENYHRAVSDACGNQKPGDFLAERAKEAYHNGYEVIQEEFLNFSPHGMWMMLFNNKAHKYIKVTEEEFLSRVKEIEELRKEMNSLLPWILLHDGNAQKQWHCLKQRRLSLIEGLDKLIDWDNCPEDGKKLSYD